MKLKKTLAVLPALLVLGACVSMPSGPSILVLPGTGKTFDQFRFDETDCRSYASALLGGKDANAAAADAGLRSAAVGTAIGAAAGAAIGGRSGAAVGAGGGLLVGSAAGSGAASTSQYGLQRRYDNSYLQCMYAKGHRVPVSGSFTSAPPSSAPPPPPPPPSATTPPPPPPR
jgi:Glycine-zipper domain